MIGRETFHLATDGALDGTDDLVRVDGRIDAFQMMAVLLASTSNDIDCIDNDVLREQ